MSRGFILRPLAQADLEDAARWYEDESDQAVVVLAVLHLRRNPKTWRGTWARLTGYALSLA